VKILGSWPSTSEDWKLDVAIAVLKAVQSQPKSTTASEKTPPPSEKKAA